MAALSCFLVLLVSSSYASGLGRLPEFSCTSPRGTAERKPVGNLAKTPSSLSMRLRGGVEVEVMDDDDAALPSDQDLSSAASVIEKIRANPELIHDAKLQFLRDFIKQYDGRIPASNKPFGTDEHHAGTSNHADGQEEEENEEDDMEDDEDIILEEDGDETQPPCSFCECKDSGDVDTMPDMGDASREPTDEDHAKVSFFLKRWEVSPFTELLPSGGRAEATGHGSCREWGLCQGSRSLVRSLFIRSFHWRLIESRRSEIIKLSPTAMAFASRGSCYLKMRKPVAAKRDTGACLR
eukprot:750154-Hanusia_phi.AAC.2